MAEEMRIKKKNDLRGFQQRVEGGSPIKSNGFHYLCSNDAIKWKSKSLSRVRLFATPWTTQSMEFSRPEYWSG